MLLRRLTHSIVTRLLLVGLAIVLLGNVLRYTLVTGFLREDLATVFSAQQLALAQHVAKDVDYKISSRVALLERLAATLPASTLNRPSELCEWLATRHDLMPLFSTGLQVFDANGRLLVDQPPRAGHDGNRLAERDDIREALRGRTWIGKPFIDTAHGVAVIPMAAPLRDGAGTTIGALAGSTALATPGFLDQVQQTGNGRTGSFLLISPRDQLSVTSSDAAMVMKPTRPGSINQLFDRAMGGYRGSGLTFNDRGEEEIAAFAPVNSAGWFVIARLPTAEAFSTITQVQRYIMRHALVVALGFLVVAAIGLVHVFRPLFVAAKHADRMTLGEIPLAALPVARDDEVGHLTNAFNRLLAKLQTSQHELAHMANHDTLTGLPNRTLLADRMNQALARSRRHGTRIAVLFLDLDGFKPINDALGHDAGDAALVQVAQRLEPIVRASDTLARVGGDEFVVVMSDLPADAAEAEQIACSVAAKCIDALQAPITLPDTECGVGLSIGIVCSDGSHAGHTLLSSADSAMYAAKKGGRGRYVVTPVE